MSHLTTNNVITLSQFLSFLELKSLCFMKSLNNLGSIYEKLINRDQNWKGYTKYVSLSTLHRWTPRTENRGLITTKRNSIIKEKKIEKKDIQQ